MDLPDAAPVHDALATAYLVDPAVIRTRRVHVAVETTGALTVGRTVMDTHFRGGQPRNATSPSTRIQDGSSSCCLRRLLRRSRCR